MAQKNSQEGWGDIIKYLGLFQIIILDLIAAPAVGLGLGYLLVKYLHFPKFILFIFGLGFFALGVTRVYLVSEKMTGESSGSSGKSKGRSGNSDDSSAT
jgi:F0F1-type ATP synthase assembly protein I